MPCLSVVQSVLCPGDSLPKDVTADTAADYRCRGCRSVAGDRESRVTTESIEKAKRRNQATADMTRQFPKGSRYVGKDWANFVDTALIEIFEEACATQRPPLRLGAKEFTFVVTGSLARRQATPYSDLEFFLVVDTDAKVKPYARMVQTMWQNIREMTEQTKAWKEDDFFNEASRFNVVTPSLRGLAFQMNSIWPNYDADIGDLGVETSLVHANMFMGGRVIAGNDRLLNELKAFLRRAKPIDDLIEDVKGAATDAADLIGKLFRTKVAAPRPIVPPEGATFNLKTTVLRPFTMCTLYLGKIYEINGTGDREHMKALYKAGRLSKEVYDLMKRTVDAAQKLRQELHAWNKEEQDDVGFGGPTINFCLRNTSAFVEMCSIFAAKMKDNASEELLRRKAFLTKTPQHYDLLKIAELCK
jgi:hypothetical protein